ncbi:MAG TPA: VOC family protein [Vicinamibacterales bacterium]
MQLRAILVLLAAFLPAALQTPRERPRITGIDHVTFRVSSAEAAGRFYGDLLGLEPASRGGSNHIVYAVGHRQTIRLEPGLPPDEDERLHHLAFATPDLEALQQHLAAAGFAFVASGACGRPALRVTDPDGHTIEFVSADWPPRREAGTAGRALSSRVLHAGLIVRDEARAHRFYRDVLGFSEIWRGGRREGTTDWVNMRVPDGTDYLEYMLEAAAPDRRQRGVLHHVCLQVPDVQAAWEEVIARTPPDVRPRPGPPNVGRNGRWQLNLYDADGTRTELMEPFTVR